MNKTKCLLSIALLSSTIAFAQDNTGTNGTNNTTTPDTTTSTNGTMPDTTTTTNGTMPDTTTTTDETMPDTTTTTNETMPDTTTTTNGTPSDTTTTTNETIPNNTNGVTPDNTNSTNLNQNSSDTNVTNLNQNTNDTNISNTNVNANVEEVNNKVSIHGVTTAPTFINAESRNNVYYLPESVSPVSGFYFLKIDSTDRVCSLKKVTRVKILKTPTTTIVKIGTKKHILYCYDRTYFNF